MKLKGKAETEMLSLFDLDHGDRSKPVQVEWDENDDRFFWLAAPAEALPN
jgi:hypothetical protein